MTALNPLCYVRAKDGIPQWGEDCVCQDPVYPSDPDGSDADCTSLPLVTLESALSYAEQVRGEALEEAAKVCDQFAAAMSVVGPDALGFTHKNERATVLMRSGATNCAAAIRALADKKGK